MIAFRHGDARLPFLWETADQPSARWHDEGEGPTHYLADTPDGAWAELIRHEEIKPADDLASLVRALWAIELPDDPLEHPRLPVETLKGGRDTYAACRAEARRLRDAGSAGFICPSAALRAGAARGWGGVRGGLEPGPDLLPRVRHF